MADLETRDWRPDRDNILWLTLATTLVLAPHVLRVPLWLSTSFAVLAGWRLAHEFAGVPLPATLLRALFTAAVPVGVFLSFGTLLGRDAGVALLVVLTGMKLVETRRIRDAYVLCFLGFFLVVTNFLFSQSIATGVYMVLAMVASVASLIAIGHPAADIAPLARLRLAGGLLLQALPIMLVLFFLFPRVSGPLWGLPKDARSGVSGLGDSMSPGNISQLSLSDAVAFRVEFDGPMPPLAMLYWRGPVLWDTDGRTWTAVKPGIHTRLRLPEFRGAPVDYTITLEPHYKRWLFALDMPATVPYGERVSDDFQLLAPRPVRERKVYRVRSYPDYRLDGLTPAEAAKALALPPGFHPRARALARGWRAETGDDERLVARALAYFNEQPFVYTLEPPLLRGDSVDEFLFQSRRGFCEYFAASFTVLMRAAGIPARIVTGYQGGEVNPLGDYLIVRQRDAHAWVEVWLGRRGWVRVDPTAAVSPDRIEFGVDAAIPPTFGPDAFGIRPSGAVRRLLQNLRFGWDTVNNAWSQWVVDYGPSRQRRLLDRIGLDVGDWRSIGAGLLAAVGGLLAAVGLWLWRRPRRLDPVARAYRRFCAKLARRGLARRPHEGPLDYGRRVIRRRPDLATEVGAITGVYVRLRYAGAGDGLRILERAVAAFRP